MITDMNDGMMDLAEAFIDGIFELFYNIFVLVLMAGIRDIFVNLFTGNVFGLSMVTVLFLIILIIGMIIAIRQWSD